MSCLGVQELRFSSALYVIVTFHNSHLQHHHVSMIRCSDQRRVYVRSRPDIRSGIRLILTRSGPVRFYLWNLPDTGSENWRFSLSNFEIAYFKIINFSRIVRCTSCFCLGQSEPWNQITWFGSSTESRDKGSHVFRWSHTCTCICLTISNKSRGQNDVTIKFNRP